MLAGLVGTLMVSAQSAWADYSIIRAATCSTYTLNDPASNAVIEVMTDTLRNNAGHYHYGYCDIKLPDGVTVNSITVHGEDSSMDKAIGFWFKRALWCAEDPDTLAAWVSTDNADPVCTTSGWNSGAINHVIDNDDYTYFFRWYMEPPAAGSMRLWNIEILYTP